MEVKFQQGTKKVCLFYSLASALHHMGRTTASKTIQMIAKKYESCSAQKQFKAARNAMTSGAPDISLPEIFNRKLKKSTCVFREMTVDDLLSSNSKLPMLVIPVGKDGNLGHCVTVLGKLIFDSTEKFAMVLSKSSLDHIVHSERGGIHRLGTVLKFGRKSNAENPMSSLLRKKRRNHKFRAGKNRQRAVKKHHMEKELE